MYLATMNRAGSVSPQQEAAPPASETIAVDRSCGFGVNTFISAVPSGRNASTDALLLMYPGAFLSHDNYTDLAKELVS